MTTYPRRYGDTDRAIEHYATACVASAKVLRSEGHQREAADLEAEAQNTLAAIDHRDHHELELGDRSGSELEIDVPRWWR